MQQFAFGPRNYKIMGIGLALLAAGFIAMKLGDKFIAMLLGDKANYGEDFIGITLGPILLILGFIVEFYAIMLRDPAAVVSGRETANPVAPGVVAGPAPVAGSPLGGPATPAVPAYRRP